ncbi:DUF4984 domain-containing protein [Bacteroides sp. 224]|uniref:DUF4984 domain-containing protein n=1 Tax=Bacteroides sp. 224 TaxID=2302936 RepID=UPI0013D82845|nr:DUF4984 domain-containing protein [Bacteroides sp. 224]
MKQLITGLVIVVTMIGSFISCSEEYTTYNGPSYVMFADTLAVYPIQQSNEAFKVDLVATKITNHDRTFGVEIIGNKGNAILGRHYTLESNSVTIKAGENKGNIIVRGNYDKIENTDTLTFGLRLASIDKSVEWDLYGIETKVQMRKACPFNIDDYAGYCRLSSSFFQNGFGGIETRKIKVEIANREKNILRFIDFYDKGYDIYMQIDPTVDVLNPSIKMVGEQTIGDSRNFFTWIYGYDGMVQAQDLRGVQTMFNTCERFAIHYMTLYVNEVGIVGSFYNIIEWSDEDEE